MASSRVSLITNTSKPSARGWSSSERQVHSRPSATRMGSSLWMGITSTVECLPRSVGGRWALNLVKVAGSRRNSSTTKPAIAIQKARVIQPKVITNRNSTILCRRVMPLTCRISNITQPPVAVLHSTSTANSRRRMPSQGMSRALLAKFIRTPDIVPGLGQGLTVQLQVKPHVGRRFVLGFQAKGGAPGLGIGKLLYLQVMTLATGDAQLGGDGMRSVQTGEFTSLEVDNEAAMMTRRRIALAWNRCPALAGANYAGQALFGPVSAECGELIAKGALFAGLQWGFRHPESHNIVVSLGIAGYFDQFHTTWPPGFLGHDPQAGTTFIACL